MIAREIQADKNTSLLELLRKIALTPACNPLNFGYYPA